MVVYIGCAFEGDPVFDADPIFGFGGSVLGPLPMDEVEGVEQGFREFLGKGA